MPNISTMEARRFSISPNSQTLSICACYQIGYTWDLYSINIDGSNLVNLTNTPAVDESKSCWAPDGDKILFVRFDGGGPNDLYIMNSDGSNYKPFLIWANEQNYPTGDNYI